MTGERSAGRLLAVNVGQPQRISWRGQAVRSAIWKEPVADRRHVDRRNVAGDAQADLVGHGGEHRAVFVYQLESYRYWEQHLGRPLTDFGQFGENLTVAGLADADVRVGDRYAIGSAVFEVTQPRVTCFKVGIRLDEPRMPALLTGHGRPGFYLRVLHEGEVGAGDEVVPITRGLAELTVERVSALLYTPDLDERALQQAIDSPALPDGWKASFRLLLEQRASKGAGNRGLSPLSAEPLAFDGLRAFRVSAVAAETPSVRSLVLEPADGGDVPAHRAGQFVHVRLEADGDDVPVVRSYSLSAAANGRSLRISVKRDGRASTLLHDRVGVGDRVELGAPRGGFVLDADDPSPLLMVSAGVGVTPLLAMLGELVEQGSERAVTWVHVARSRAEHALAREARELLDRLRDAVVHVRYTQPQAGDRPGDGFDGAGRLSAQHLGELGVTAAAAVYVCGPAGFMRDVRDALTALGVDEARIHTEAFGAAARPVRPPHPPEEPPSTGPVVSFARSGITARFDEHRWTSLLELAEACDVPADWSCRSGVCHRCESGLVTGEVTYDPEPLDRPAAGVALLCCARPSRDVVLDL